jgi:hypothetical protein
VVDDLARKRDCDPHVHRVRDALESLLVTVRQLAEVADGSQIEQSVDDVVIALVFDR